MLFDIVLTAKPSFPLRLSTQTVLDFWHLFSRLILVSSVSFSSSTGYRHFYLSLYLHLLMCLSLFESFVLAFVPQSVTTREYSSLFFHRFSFCLAGCFVSKISSSSLLSFVRVLAKTSLLKNDLQLFGTSFPSFVLNFFLHLRNKKPAQNIFPHFDTIPRNHWKEFLLLTQYYKLLCIFLSDSLLLLLLDHKTGLRNALLLVSIAGFWRSNAASNH